MLLNYGMDIHSGGWAEMLAEAPKPEGQPEPPDGSRPTGDSNSPKITPRIDELGIIKKGEDPKTIERRQNKLLHS